MEDYQQNKMIIVDVIVRATRDYRLWKNKPDKVDELKELEGWIKSQEFIDDWLSWLTTNENMQRVLIAGILGELKTKHGQLFAFDDGMLQIGNYDTAREDIDVLDMDDIESLDSEN